MTVYVVTVVVEDEIHVRVFENEPTLSILDEAKQEFGEGKKFACTKVEVE